MNSDTSLPPQLERFVREQVVAGRFPSEGEVIRAALRLLEQSSRTVPGPPAVGKRSPRGLLADLPSGLGYDDFKDARAELWAGLRPGDGG